MTERTVPVAAVSALMALALCSGALAGDKTAAGKETKAFSVKVEKTAAAIMVTAKGESGYHCNTLYPWKMTVEGPGGQQLVYRKQDAKVFSEKAVVFELPRAAGQKARLKMSVCDEKQCLMHTEELSW